MRPEGRNEGRPRDDPAQGLSGKDHHHLPGVFKAETGAENVDIEDIFKSFGIIK